MKYIDSILRYALGTRLWQAGSALVTMMLILRFTQPMAQGLFYTFSAVLNLQIFFELGLSFVILQSTPHYFKSLLWGAAGQIHGPQERQERFLAFARKGLRLYLIIALLFILLMIPLGWYFFGLHQQDYGTVWRLPWMLLVLGTAFNLCLSPIVAMLEGSGKIQQVYRLRWRQLMLANVVAWLVFFATNALYLSVVNVWLTAATTCFWLYRSHKALLKALLYYPTVRINFSWAQEIWPMQWRIAISWMSGYFINQIFTPLLFYYQGAIVSGQMGLCLTVVNMLSLFAITWITVRSPNMGDLAARGERKALDRLFTGIFWQSVVVFVLGALGLMLLLYGLQGYAIRTRLLPLHDLLLLLMAYLFVHIIGALSLYLRAHKIELFAPLSVVGAILLAFSAWYAAAYDGSAGVCWSIVLVNGLYGFPSGLWLWLKFKKNWRTEDSNDAQAYD